VGAMSGTQGVGDFGLTRVVEMEGPTFAPGELFPDATADVFEAHKDWLVPRHVDPATGQLVMCVQTYIVRTPRHTILVDTCVGNHKSRPARAAWHMRDGPFLADLAAAGVHPEAVDFVLCTHLHVDHVGWNTRLLDGRWVPTFPNAKYIFARREYDFWEERLRAALADGHGEDSPFADSVLPVMEAGQAVLVDMDHGIEDGVWLEPAPGHTAGNVVVNLRSGAERAVLTGDVMHHPVQLLRPDWSSGFCEDKALSHSTRRAIIERYAETDTLIAPAHFASPTVGRIVRMGDCFGFRN
jgi:glyoxylase-like metal-dependent hydrolase (beta-lactamase superfamily II)